MLVVTVTVPWFSRGYGSGFCSGRIGRTYSGGSGSSAGGFLFGNLGFGRGVRLVGRSGTVFVWGNRMEGAVGGNGGEGGVVSSAESARDCSATVDLVYGSGPHSHAISTVCKSTNIRWHECPVGKHERQKLLGQKGCVIWITGLSGSGPHSHAISTVGKSTNIRWHECPVGKHERQKLLGQKGCVIWITGLSGSGKSTLACALSRELHFRGSLTYVLDGDNVRHGLNRDLSFKQEDRAENIRRIGEVAKLFADAGIICIASLISPYRRDRDACRALLPTGTFIEVFMDTSLEICETRDSKGLYKLARAGKIKGFTGIDDPYETPLTCEITLKQKDGTCPSPTAMAKQVVAYLEEKGFLKP